MTREALLAEVDAEILNVDCASAAIEAYRALEKRIVSGIPKGLGLREWAEALEGLRQLRKALRCDIGYAEFYVSTCRYRILRTPENLTAFRKRAAKLPKRCF